MTFGTGMIIGTARVTHVENPSADEYIAATLRQGYRRFPRRGHNRLDSHLRHGRQLQFGSRHLPSPASNMSAHYVMRNADGYTVQIVHYEDIAYYVGSTTALWDESVGAVNLGAKITVNWCEISSSEYTKPADSIDMAKLLR